jgi:hypothetical protein
MVRQRNNSSPPLLMLMTQHVSVIRPSSCVIQERTVASYLLAYNSCNHNSLLHNQLPKYVRKYKRENNPKIINLQRCYTWKLTQIFIMKFTSKRRMYLRYVNLIHLNVTQFILNVNLIALNIMKIVLDQICIYSGTHARINLRHFKIKYLISAEVMLDISQCAYWYSQL